MKDFLEKHQWQAFALLTAMGTIINCCPFSLHYRVDLLFGGIFGILALCVIPGFKGVFSAAIISIPSYFLWNHPLGILLYTCEALLLMVLLKKTRFQLVFSAMIIWIFILPPAFYIVMNLSNWFFPAATRLFILKYTLNGIFNAAVVSLLMTILNLRIIQKPDSMTEARISEIAVNLMLIITIIPLLVFMVLDSRLLTSSILSRIECRHRSKHNSIKATIRQWREQRKKTLTSIAKMHLTGQNTISTNRQNLQFFLNSQIDLHSIRIYDKTGKLIEAASKSGQQNYSSNLIINDIMLQNYQMDEEIETKPDILQTTGTPVFFNSLFAGYVSGEASIKPLIDSLKRLKDNELEFLILDEKGGLLFSVDSDSESMAFRKQNYKIIPMQANLKMLHPMANIISSKRFLLSKIFSETAMTGSNSWKIIVQEPMQGFIENLFNTSFNQFTYILLLIFAVFLISPVTQKVIAKPLENLATVTSDIEHDGIRPEHGQAEESRIFEIKQLTKNFSAAVTAIASARERDKIQAQKLEKANSILQEKIEQLKIAHFKAEKAEKSFAVLVNNSPFIVIISDRTGFIEFSNSALRSITAKEFSYVKEIFQILTPYEETPFPTAEFLNCFSNVAMRDTTFAGELTYVQNNQSGIVNCIATIIESVCILIMFDVTQISLAKAAQKRLEEQMHANQKLESLGILAGGVAHDFNNILLSILGYAELTLMEMPTENRLRSNIEMIEASAQRAAKLTMQILAYTGNRNFISRPFDLTAIARDMLSMLSVSIPPNINVSCSLNGELHCEGDSTQIGQIIMNLLINASEAIGEHPGKITVATGSLNYDDEHLNNAIINYTLKNTKRYAFLEITDSGCGIKSNDLPKIFDPFFTTKFTGRGLGLAASMGTVKAHHGAISVSSQPGKGSRFMLILPASESVSAPAIIKNNDYRELNLKGKVLLVDDEETVLSITGLMLEGLNLEIITAADGIEAIEKFQLNSSEISLVILDMVMPRMKGEEAFIKIKEINPNVPIIVSSGFTREETLSRLSEVEVEGFMQKPFRRNELIDEIARVLKKNHSPA